MSEQKKKIKRSLPAGKELHVLAPGYLQRVTKLQRYAPEEVALRQLFTQTYPANKSINEILIKVIALDSSYSTNLRRFSSISAMAEVIKDINDFDVRLAQGDHTLVDEMCSKMQSLENEIDPNVRYPKPFSFATKYCCNHNEDDFPIYDSFVAKVITRYQRTEAFLPAGDVLRNRWDEAYRMDGIISKEEALKVSYADLFVPIVTRFRDTYCKTLSYRQLDRFLWLLGKEYLGEGMPEAIVEESVVIGNYVVIVEEWGSISIFELCTDTKEALIDCAENIHYRRPENASDRDVALAMLRVYSGSKTRESFPVGDYYIDCREDDVKVYERVGNRSTKATMAKINDFYPFGFDAKKTTRQNGKNLVKKVKAENN